MKNSNYTKACERMFELVKRDHGDCGEEDCIIRKALEDDFALAEEAIRVWACSGASDDEFDKLYERWGKRLEKELGFI